MRACKENLLAHSPINIFRLNKGDLEQRYNNSLVDGIKIPSPESRALRPDGYFFSPHSSNESKRPKPCVGSSILLLSGFFFPIFDLEWRRRLTVLPTLFHSSYVQLKSLVLCSFER